MRSHSSEDAETMGAQEAADALGISLPTLHRRVKAGDLTPLPKTPGQKRHYRLRFYREAILEMVQKGMAF